LFLRGNASLKMRDYEGAARDLTAFLRLDPDCVPALYGRGLAFSKMNMPEKVVLFTLQAFYFAMRSNSP
jgi:hypothetical protein